MPKLLLFSLLLVLCTQPSLGGESGEGLTALPERPVAPEFALSDTEGNLHRLSDYRGKVVIVNFWATWCPPCRDEMPSMQRAWEQLEQEGILLLGIDVGENEEKIFQFSADYRVEFPLLMDLDSSVTTSWPLAGLPTTFVVDPQGRLAYRAVGGREWDDPELLAQIRALQQQ